MQCTLPCSPEVKVTVQSVLGQSGARAKACRAVGQQKLRARGLCAGNEQKDKYNKSGRGGEGERWTIRSEETHETLRIAQVGDYLNWLPALLLQPRVSTRDSLSTDCTLAATLSTALRVQLMLRNSLHSFITHAIELH